MTKIQLKSKMRDVIGKKVKQFRKDGLVPAVVYGHKKAARNIWINLLDLKKTYSKAGESTLIELEVDGKNVNALIHDVQVEPMSRNFCHVDFFEVNMNEKIEADVPLDFVGESEAIKALGGMLLKNADAIQVSCLPGDLMSKIEVDISAIKTFDDHIKVKDLKISDKVKVLSDMEMVVAGVVPPRTEEEMAKLDEKVEEDVTKVEGVVKETPETAETKETKEAKESKETK